MAVSPSIDDLTATLDPFGVDPFGVASSILLAANTKYPAVTTRAKDLAGHPPVQNEAQLNIQKKV